jgi:hypothetical protein
MRLCAHRFVHFLTSDLIAIQHRPQTAHVDRQTSQEAYRELIRHAEAVTVIQPPLLHRIFKRYFRRN